MVRRHVTPLSIHSLQRFPVVLPIGARQVGKSTPVREGIRTT